MNNSHSLTLSRSHIPAGKPQNLELDHNLSQLP